MRNYNKMLEISSVSVKNSGEYVCYEEQFSRTSEKSELIVGGKYPIIE